MQTSGPPATTGRKAEGEVVIGVRPEGMLPSPEGDGMAVTVDVIEDLGSRRYCADDFRTVDAEAGGDGPAVLTARVPGDSAIGVGERIMLRPHHGQVHVFSPTTGERLD
jgi:multiple sugar transport system ATP-binding protein